MDPNPQLELLVRPMPDSKRERGFEQGERHARYLPGMYGAVPVGQSGYDHVGVTDCLHLFGTNKEENREKNNISDRDGDLYDKKHQVLFFEKTGQRGQN